jgi:hypothetical protein
MILIFVVCSWLFGPQNCFFSVTATVYWNDNKNVLGAFPWI